MNEPVCLVFIPRGLFSIWAYKWYNKLDITSTIKHGNNQREVGFFQRILSLIWRIEIFEIDVMENGLSTSEVFDVMVNGVSTSEVCEM